MGSEFGLFISKEPARLQVGHITVFNSSQICPVLLDFFIYTSVL